MKTKDIKPQPSTVGLVAHYKLWSGLTSTAKVFDYALNGFVGVPAGTDIAPAYPGFKLNGTDDNIAVGTGPSSVKTIAMWVNPDSIAGSDYSIDLNFTDFLSIVTGTLTKNGFAGGTTALYVDGEAATSVTTNWHLIGITDTSAKNALNLSIGSVVFTIFFAGLIGETMLFDTLKTPAEMKSIYELTKWRYPNN